LLNNASKITRAYLNPSSIAGKKYGFNMKEQGTSDLGGSRLPDRLKYSLKVVGHRRVQLDLELDSRLHMPDVEIGGYEKGSKKGKSRLKVKFNHINFFYHLFFTYQYTFKTFYHCTQNCLLKYIELVL